MSKRYSEYRDYKGSSRAPRDDSRTQKEPWSSRDRERRQSRSRSRSPQRSFPGHSRSSPDRDRVGTSSSNRDVDSKHKYEDKKLRLSNEWEESDDEVPAPPPPPRITKISIGFSKPKEPIKMTIGGAGKPATSAPKPSVASVFNDDDDEPEEMPAEARMRMRNIGRETPTSAGPNSFGKTKQGFCDAKKVFEKNLKQALETNPTEKPTGKFPQTIYKIKGP